MSDSNEPRDAEHSTGSRAATASVDGIDAHLVAGRVLGGRYEIRGLLGRGGMGSVWRAFDLKLRVEVALKSVRPDILGDDRRLELLRREVRAAREVMSPNVCRIFDLVEADGAELVSMELVDGSTLLELLRERGPLELKQAQEIASQFLAGLEAIHAAGLVHRDVKPENIMITRSGRVVVMDFGLARSEHDPSHSVSGTPAYMAPEQLRGEAVDARADVYAAGVVLAEMVSPKGVRSLQSRQTVWEGIRHEPPRLPSSPWAAVLGKAVAKEPEQRYASAHTLTRALEDVTLRVEGAEDLRPYPGLASFTEEDAEYFFGREAEVEAMWRRLEGTPRLLGLVGPSGAGKTSFLRAGLIPSAGAGWRVVRCTPGDDPFRSLRQELVSELAGDAEALRELVDVKELDTTISAVARWRRRHEHAVLAVDQFEELFTQNDPATQRRFAELVARIVLEADVVVMLSMRDDFLSRCHEHEALRPLASGLTFLNPLSGADLRRAIVQPAMRCGYRFEDDGLVEDMLAEVQGERGALPLLAFAMARMWERRDGENGLLTREAYRDIGGVGGALARHAEAVMERIGPDRLPVVRELLRNLVTAERTRAVREWNELLSVFEDRQREVANHVLCELIDARLLTSYEVRDEDREPTRRVEVIHESLLARWPRLVRWLTQDADAAQLRDQLRQAARTWNEHGRSDDLLWSGSAYREFALWRERYSGGLTALEGAFAEAMSRFASRRRRRRRLAVAAAFAALLAVLAIIGGLWRRSNFEARRAEAAGLFSLAQLRLEEQPSVALAYATASLELADSLDVRLLALEALQKGPTEIRLATPSPFTVDFSPDGRWLATAGRWQNGGMLWPSDGGPPTALEDAEIAQEITISPRGDLVATTMDPERRTVGLWTFPDGRFVRSLDLGNRGSAYFIRFSRDGERLYTSSEIIAPGGGRMVLEIRSWPVDGSDPGLVAHLDIPVSGAYGGFNIDPTDNRLSWIDGRRVLVAPLEGGIADLESATVVEHDRPVRCQTIDDSGQRLATFDMDRVIRIWSLATDPPGLIRTITGGVTARAGTSMVFSPSGSLLANAFAGIWKLTDPIDTAPMRLFKGTGFIALDFDWTGGWLASGSFDSVSLWPLAGEWPRDLRGHEKAPEGGFFTPDGGRLVSYSQDGSVRLWPLVAEPGAQARVLYRAEGAESPAQMTMAPDGSFVVVINIVGRVAVVPLDGGPVRELTGFTEIYNPPAVGPRSRFVAASGGGLVRSEALVRVWDLSSDEVLILDAEDGMAPSGLEFTSEGDLWVVSGSKLRLWSLQSGVPQVVEEIDLAGSTVLDGVLCGRKLDLPERRLTYWAKDRLWVHDLDSGESRELGPHEGPVESCVVSNDGATFASFDGRALVRVAPINGGPSHLLFGHTPGGGISLSPDGRWIAGPGPRSALRLWPMPDLSKPPLHTLPREKLLARLKSLTNMRVVEDPDSPTGWKLEVGPFPGWETVPSW